MKGKLIVIEGTDGSGKKTQTQLLYNKLKEQGLNVIKINYPRYNLPSSVLVKKYLSGEFGSNPSLVDPKIASSLYAFDRLFSYMTEWKSHYENGGIIIADRYATANFVHQAGKLMHNLEERDKLLQWLDKLEYEEHKIPRPNKVFFLDLPPKVCLDLMKNRVNKFSGKEEKDIHETYSEFNLNSYNNACDLAEKFNWIRINCFNNKLKTPEEIHCEIFNELKKD